jgi:hypothetical protein
MRPGSAPEPTAQLNPERVRLLLRKLRDLNLTAERIEIGLGAYVDLEGCLTLDQPVESALTYRVRHGDGALETLDLSWDDGALRLTRQRPGSPQASLRVELLGNGSGPAMAPELKARIDPEEAGSREVTHFLRRLVRLAYAPA